MSLAIMTAPGSVPSSTAFWIACSSSSIFSLFYCVSHQAPTHSVHKQRGRQLATRVISTIYREKLGAMAPRARRRYRQGLSLASARFPTGNLLAVILASTCAARGHGASGPDTANVWDETRSWAIYGPDLWCLSYWHECFG